ncbi:MAG: hypothetical protein U0L92_06560 [Clostridia bacterium]|nr:hypothetical protein [Clostridia bacterium]
MLKTNQTKRGICLCAIIAMLTSILVIGGQWSTAVTVHADTVQKNISAPIFSATLDFETAKVGTYAQTEGDGIEGTVVNDGGGLELKLSDGSPDYAVARVKEDTTGKFNGSKVLEIQPLPEEVSGQTIARLYSSNAEIGSTFRVKDSSGKRLSHGYRMMYSYDFYTTISSGFSAQDVWWLNSSNSISTSETLLNTKKSNLHNPSTSVTSSTTAGTIGWNGSAWTQTDHPNVIHMDYVFDFETGEVWMYSDGTLFACRDFSEMERSYFNPTYQSLENAYGVLFQFRQSGDTGTIYYDNFRVAMYDESVEAQQLCELAAEPSQAFHGSAVTESKTADFEKAMTADGFGMSVSKATIDGTSTDAVVRSLENGRLKLKHNVNVGTNDSYMNIEPKYNKYAETNSRADGLPNPPVGTTAVPSSAYLFSKRLGFDRRGVDENGNFRYNLYSLAYIDYLKFSVDIEMDEKNEGDAWLYACWYPFDGVSHNSDTMPEGMGVKATYNPNFIRFNKEEGQSGGSILAFGNETEMKWQMGSTYHVDYLVNLKTGKEETYLDGVLLGSNMAGEDITERGTFVRVRTNFERKTDSDIIYLDNINYTIYNELNISFETLEKQMSYKPAITDLGAQLTADNNVEVTAKISGDAEKFSEPKIITALYKNYGTKDAELLKVAIDVYRGEDDAFSTLLSAGEETDNLTVKMFIWSFSDLIPLCEAGVDTPVL